jgi:Tol biopolymer transport system component
MTPTTFRKARLCRFVESACTFVVMHISITGSTMAQGTPTPAPVVNGKIAFTRQEWDSYKPEIYLIDPDGSNETNLTNNPLGRRRRSQWYGDRDPAWSPDGSRIAFSRHGVQVQNGTVGWDIYLMDADGSNETRLTYDYGPHSSPTWSPDGQKIALVSYHAQIYVMEKDGSNLLPLTNGPALNIEPVWSPDGARIAFMRFTADTDTNEIYVMDADGSNQTRLTNSPGGSRHPAWSPDGARITFDSNRDFNGGAIYVMDADGSNQMALSNIPSFDLQPDWSPDGTKIAFMSLQDGYSAIYLMDADGSNRVRLTSNHLNSSVSAPRWQRLPVPPTPTPTPGPRQ